MKHTDCISEFLHRVSTGFKPLKISFYNEYSQETVETVKVIHSLNKRPDSYSFQPPVDGLWKMLKAEKIQKEKQFSRFPRERFDWGVVCNWILTDASRRRVILFPS